MTDTDTYWNMPLDEIRKNFYDESLKDNDDVGDSWDDDKQKQNAEYILQNWEELFIQPMSLPKNNFDMGKWGFGGIEAVKKYKKHKCGTSACFAGWLFLDNKIRRQCKEKDPSYLIRDTLGESREWLERADWEDDVRSCWERLAYCYANDGIEVYHIGDVCQWDTSKLIKNTEYAKVE